MKIKAEIVLSPGGAYFSNWKYIVLLLSRKVNSLELTYEIIQGIFDAAGVCEGFCRTFKDAMSASTQISSQFKRFKD